MDKKVRLTLQLDSDLLDMLKEEAKAKQCSLNSYVEKVLADDIGNIPNEATKAAIVEARNELIILRIGLTNYDYEVLPL